MEMRIAADTKTKGGKTSFLRRGNPHRRKSLTRREVIFSRQDHSVNPPSGLIRVINHELEAREDLDGSSFLFHVTGVNGRTAESLSTLRPLYSPSIADSVAVVETTDKWTLVVSRN